MRARVRPASNKVHFMPLPFKNRTDRLSRVASTRSGTTLRERQKAGTRRELLNAALEIFSEVGFGLARVEDIAARAGAAKGTVYSYFPQGKDDLFRELYADLGQRTIEHAEELRAPVDDPLERIVATARALLDVCSDSLVGRFFMIDGPALGQVVKPLLGKTSGRYRELVSDDLAAARRAGAITSKVSTDTLATLLVGAIRAAGQIVSEDPSATSRLLAGIRDLVYGL